MQKDENLPRCTQLNEIRTHEGERIQVTGLLIAPRTGKGEYRLKLKRGEHIALGHFTSESGLGWEDLAAYAGKPVMITGRVYFEHIPDTYGIYARTEDPYLVDVTNIEIWRAGFLEKLLRGLG